MKIEYLTINLFVYNLVEGLPKNSKQVRDRQMKFWAGLPKQLQDLSAKVTESPEFPDFISFQIPQTVKILHPIHGFYLQEEFETTIGWQFDCSVKGKVEENELLTLLPKVKSLACLPHCDELPPGRLSEEGYLGETWMVSGWSDTNINETIAGQIYQSLLGQEYQHCELGEFLGVTVFEMWRAVQKWEGIEKDSHLMVIIYRNESIFKQESDFYDYWRYLLYCRHKILWAYGQGRELKVRLLSNFNQTLHNQDFTQDTLEELKQKLQENTNNLFGYVRNLNALEVQLHTVEVNLLNYEKQCQAFFKDQKFLETFADIVRRKYQLQLEKDYASLNPGLKILENTTATIRGMVEIEQAKSDRIFQVTIGVLGLGIGTASITASAIAPFIETITGRQSKTIENPKEILIPENAWFNSGAAFVISALVGLCVISVSCGIIQIINNRHRRSKK